MTLVAVSDGKRHCGVESPERRVKGRVETFDWRSPPGDAANTRRVRAAYELVDLGNALAATYPTDAHFVAYVLQRDGQPQMRQPRVNKGGLPWLRAQGFDLAVEALVCDVDNPDHGDWTPKLRAEFEALRWRAPALSTAGIYTTAHGWRVVQPLARGVSVERAEACLRVWLAVLESQGIRVDWTCTDWTRHFRAPNVRRAGQFVKGEIMLDRMKAIAPPATVDAPARQRGAGKPRRPDGVIAAEALPPTWELHVARLAAQMRASGLEGQRHDVKLSLAGALLGRGVPPESVPSIVAAACLTAGWDSATAWTDARDTVDRWAAGASVKGARALGEIAPHVLAAVDQATLPAAARAMASAAAEVANDVEPTEETLAEITERMTQTMREAPDGVTLIRAQCGLGKTNSAMIVALERAAKMHASAGEHTRAPLGSKTAISVPTTALAVELVGRLRAAEGSGVVRMFGPLSVMREDGECECKYAPQAGAMAAGGQSIPWEFCSGRGREPCDVKSTCPAAEGRDGPEDARIAVGPHTMLGALREFAGSTGLLVIDEPPPMLATVVLTRAQLEETAHALKPFEYRYGAALAPVLHAMSAWLGAEGEALQVWPLEHILEGRVDAAQLREALDATGLDVEDLAPEGQALAASRAAFDADHDGGIAPPVRRADMYGARENPAYAARVGAASKVLLAVWTLCNVERSAVRLEERGGERVMVCTWVDAAYREALRRQGVTLALDANAELHVDVMRSVLGAAPPLHSFAAPDGAPVERTLYQLGTATRRAWMLEGRLVATRELLDAVRVAAAWLDERPDPDGAGIITMRPLRLALEAAVDGRDVAAAWVAAGQRKEDLDGVVKALGAQLGGLKGRVVRWGHYGGMRGIDSWRSLSALVTIGDPWQNVGDTQHETDFLGLTGELRGEAQCAAELEQAHGRLRVVHRTKPARALHVGGVRPGGWLPGRFGVRRAESGRRRNEGAMALDELRQVVVALGGATAASRTVGASRATLNRYLAGERAIPSPLATLLRGAVATAAE